MTITEHLIGRNIYNCYLLCSCDTSIGYTEAELTHHLLDVGREAAKGELVTLNDPRIKEGARLRLEWPDADSDYYEAAEGLVTEYWPYSDGGARLAVASHYLSRPTDIYLLAEAPDPDAEVLEALWSAVEDWSRDSAADDLGALLVALRAAGWDIVRTDGAR